jgi:hypothetical protein
LERREWIVVISWPFQSAGRPSDGVRRIRRIMPQTPEEPDGETSVLRTYFGAAGEG